MSTQIGETLGLWECGLSLKQTDTRFAGLCLYRTASLDPTLNSNQVNLRRTNSLKCGGFRNLVPGLCEVMLYNFQKALIG